MLLKGLMDLRQHFRYIVFNVRRFVSSVVTQGRLSLFRRYNQNGSENGDDDESDSALLRLLSFHTLSFQVGTHKQKS